MKEKRNSISKSLREQNKSNDYFEILLGNLTLEELIALKLELGWKAIGFKLEGFPLWVSAPYIIRSALLRAVVSVADNKVEAKRILGLKGRKFFSLLTKYGLTDVYERKKIYDNNR
jgi:hypothetical protein